VSLLDSGLRRTARGRAPRQVAARPGAGPAGPGRGRRTPSPARVRCTWRPSRRRSVEWARSRRTRHS